MKTINNIIHPFHCTCNSLQNLQSNIIYLSIASISISISIFIHPFILPSFVLSYLNNISRESPPLLFGLLLLLLGLLPRLGLLLGGGWWSPTRMTLLKIERPKYSATVVKPSTDVSNCFKQWGRGGEEKEGEVRKNNILYQPIDL